MLATDLLGHVLPPPKSSDPQHITVAGDYAYFWVGGDQHRNIPSILHRSDGTPTGTSSLDVRAVGYVDSAVIGDRYVARVGQDIYATQGTVDSTVLLTEGIEADWRNPLFAFNGRVFFFGEVIESMASEGQKTSLDLMVTDGTPEGTGYLFPTMPTVSRYVTYQGVFDQRLMFQFETDVVPANHQTWLTDGTLAGTTLVDPGEGGLDNVQVHATVGDFFVGTKDGQLALVDRNNLSVAIVSSKEGSSIAPVEFVMSPDRVFFTTSNNRSLSEVWVTDGTELGTKRIARFDTTNSGDPTPAPAGWLVWFRERLYFAADHAMWAYDPQTDSLEEILRRPLNQLETNYRFRGLNEFTVYGEHLIFAGNSSDFGDELWISDGTAEGTRLLANVGPGIAHGNPLELTLWDDQLLFTAEHPDVGRELWTVDLVTEELQLLADLHRGYETRVTVTPSVLSQMNDLAFFKMDTNVHGQELWVTDGSADRTRLLKDITPGSGGWIGDRFTTWNNRFYFLADDGIHGRELWSTDGTESGTRLELDYTPGPGSSFESSRNGSIFPTSRGVVLPLDGLTLWNGTAASTLVPEEQMPTTNSSVQVDIWDINGEQVLLAGDSVYRPNPATGIYERFDFIFGANARGVLLDDGSTVVVRTNGGVQTYNFATSESSLLTDRQLQLATVGDFVVGWSGTQLVAWHIDEWVPREIQLDSPVVELLPFGSGSRDDTLYFGLSDRLVSLNTNLEVTTLVDNLPWVRTNRFVLSDDHLVYTGASPTRFAGQTLFSTQVRADSSTTTDINADFLDALFASVAQKQDDGSATIEDESLRPLDLNEDSILNELDIDFAFDEVLQTHRADLDLDGSVNFADFLALSANFGQQESRWSEGDITGDGVIDFADFLLLSSAFGTEPGGNR